MLVVGGAVSGEGSVRACGAAIEHYSFLSFGGEEGMSAVGWWVYVVGAVWVLWGV